MNISSKLISKDWNYLFDNEDTVFLILVFLHYNEHISRKRLLGMFKNLKAGKLLRKVNTYHCKINDRWYNDEGMFTILYEAYTSKKIVKDSMDLEEFIKYINLYLNKPRNYCIDHIYHRFILPLIEQYENYDNRLIYLGYFNIYMPDINNQTFAQYEPWGYCCEDCDGDYNSYKRYGYESNVKKNNIKNLEKTFSTYLDSQRKKGYLLNPKRL